MNRFYSSQKGFTLIELLIVIVIIGILAGVVFGAINPATQIRKANQTVYRTTSEKACFALLACAATTSTALDCNNFADIGFTDPGAPVIAWGWLPAVPVAGSTLRLTATYDTCSITCSVTPSTGAVINFALDSSGATCLIS